MPGSTQANRPNPPPPPTGTAHVGRIVNKTGSFQNVHNIHRGEVAFKNTRGRKERPVGLGTQSLDLVVGFRVQSTLSYW